MSRKCSTSGSGASWREPTRVMLARSSSILSYVDSHCSTAAPGEPELWLSGAVLVPEDEAANAAIVARDLAIDLEVSRPVDDGGPIFLCTVRPRGCVQMPADIVCAVDVSGSMAIDGRLAAAQSALMHLLELLEPGDRAALVTFNHEARVLRGLSSPSAVSAAVQGLCASGGTRIGAGLYAALEVLRQRRSRNPSSAVVLLTDGIDNDARATEAKLAELREALDEGCQLYCLGFGTADFDLLLDISHETSYPFAFVCTPQSLSEALGNILRQCHHAMAKSVLLSAREAAKPAEPAEFLTMLRLVDGAVRFENLAGEVRVLVRAAAPLRAELRYVLADGQIGRVEACSEDALENEEAIVRTELLKYQLGMASVGGARPDMVLPAEAPEGLRRFYTAMEENAPREQMTALGMELLLQRRVTSD